MGQHEPHPTHLQADVLLPPPQPWQREGGRVTTCRRVSALLFSPGWDGEEGRNPHCTAEVGQAGHPPHPPTLVLDLHSSEADSETNLSAQLRDENHSPPMTKKHLGDGVPFSRSLPGGNHLLPAKTQGCMSFAS